MLANGNHVWVAAERAVQSADVKSAKWCTVLNEEMQGKFNEKYRRLRARRYTNQEKRDSMRRRCLEKEVVECIPRPILSGG